MTFLKRHEAAAHLYEIPRYIPFLCCHPVLPFPSQQFTPCEQWNPVVSRDMLGLWKSLAFPSWVFGQRTTWEFYHRVSQKVLSPLSDLWEDKRWSKEPTPRKCERQTVFFTEKEGLWAPRDRVEIGTWRKCFGSLLAIFARTHLPYPCEMEPPSGS